MLANYETIIARPSHNQVSAAADNFFFNVFKNFTRGNGLGVTSDEAKFIDDMIPMMRDGIQYYLSCLHTGASTGSLDTAKMLRSGIQIFIDAFCVGCTDEPCAVCHVFGDELRELDELLKVLCGDPLVDASLKMEISKLPASHWWLLD